MKNNIYNTLELSQYIVNKHIELSSPISNLKLQKLLYYIQGAFLIEKGKVAFEDKILAWKYGPVVEDVYDEYKKYFGLDIKEKITEEKEIKFYSVEDKEIIDKIIISKLNKTSYELVHKTKKEDPYKNAKNEEFNITKIIGPKVISTIDIRNYFSKNKDEIY